MNNKNNSSAPYTNNTTLTAGSCRFFDDLIVTDKLETWATPAITIPKIALRVKKVIVQPNKQIVIVIFPNGDKSIAKCGKDDVFSVEKGVAIAISKYVLGSGSEFKRLVENATIQEVKKKEIIEVGDIVEITSVDIFPEIPTKSELGKLGEVIFISEDNCGVQTEYVKKVYDEDSFWIVSRKALKLIKKKEGE